MKRWLHGGFILVAVSCFPLQRARSETVADAIPGSAKAAVIVTNAQELEKNVRAFAQAAGFSLPESIGLDKALQASGLAGVWQPERGAAFVVTAAEMEGLAVVLAVADAKAALAKMNATADGDLFKLTFMGSPAVALPKGRWLVLSPSAKGLEPFRRIDQTLSGQWKKLEKELSVDADLFVYVNIAELKQIALTGLDAFEQQFKPQLIGMAAAGGADPAQLTRMFDLYAKALRVLANEGRAFCLGASVSGERLQIQPGLAFRPDTSLAKYFQDEDETKTAELIEKLPLRPFVLAMGLDTGLGGDLWQDASTAMLGMVGNLDKKERERIAEYLDQVIETLDSWSMLVDFGADGLTMLGRYEVDDAKDFLKLLRDGQREAAGLVQALMPKGKIDVAVSTKEVDNRKVTEFRYAYSDLPAEQAKMQKVLYGGDIIKTQLVAFDDDSVGFASSGKGDPIQQLFDAGQLIKEPRIKTALSNLPEKAGAVALLDPTAVVRVAAAVVDKVGQPLPIRLPTYDKPPVPIAVAVMGQQNGVTARLVIRADTVREVAKPFLGR